MMALSCGGCPHHGQSGPDFTLPRLVRQLGSKHTFLCKPLENARDVHGEAPSMDF